MRCNDILMQSWCAVIYNQTVWWCLHAWWHGGWKIVSLVAIQLTDYHDYNRRLQTVSKQNVSVKDIEITFDTATCFPLVWISGNQRRTVHVNHNRQTQLKLIVARLLSTNKPEVVGVTWTRKLQWLYKSRQRSGRACEEDPARTFLLLSSSNLLETRLKEFAEFAAVLNSCSKHE